MQKKTNLPVDVYPASTGKKYQARLGDKYLGTFATIEDAKKAHQAAFDSRVIKQPKSREPTINANNKCLEYCILQRKNSFYVLVNSGNKTIYVGGYKNIEIARMARNDAMRLHKIKANPWVKGFSLLPDDLKKHPEDKEANTREPHTDKRKKMDGRIAKDVQKNAHKTAKPASNTTISFAPPINVEPIDDEVARNDGIYFLKNAWRVFRTTQNKQRQFVASSSEEARLFLNGVMGLGLGRGDL